MTVEVTSCGNLSREGVGGGEPWSVGWALLRNDLRVAVETAEVALSSRSELVRFAADAFVEVIVGATDIALEVAAASHSPGGADHIVLEPTFIADRDASDEIEQPDEVRIKLKVD